MLGKETKNLKTFSLNGFKSCFISKNQVTPMLCIILQICLNIIKFFTKTNFVKLSTFKMFNYYLKVFILPIYVVSTICDLYFISCWLDLAEFNNELSSITTAENDLLRSITASENDLLIEIQKNNHSLENNVSNLQIEQENDLKKTEIKKEKSINMEIILLYIIISVLTGQL
jgi:hypothetical protein